MSNIDARMIIALYYAVIILLLLSYTYMAVLYGDYYHDILILKWKVSSHYMFSFEEMIRESSSICVHSGHQKETERLL